MRIHKRGTAESDGKLSAVPVDFLYKTEISYDNNVDLKVRIVFWPYDQGFHTAEEPFRGNGAKHRALIRM